MLPVKHLTEKLHSPGGEGGLPGRRSKIARRDNQALSRPGFRGRSYV